MAQKSDLHGLSVLFSAIKSLEVGVGGDVRVNASRLLNHLVLRFTWEDGIFYETKISETDCALVFMDEVMKMAIEARRKQLEKRRDKK